MTITREEIAAFADGQLQGERGAEVALAVAADPALAEQVRQHHALKDRLVAHFGPVLSQPLPEHLTAPLTVGTGTVVDLAAVREQRNRSRGLPNWSWIAGPALAASIALAVFLPSASEGDYAAGALADTLERQLVANQAARARTRILLSFRDKSGSYCRAFSSNAVSGIACRDPEGWRLQSRGKGAPESDAEYRMAENADALLLQQAQQLAVGPALDADQERAAQSNDWQ